MCPERTATISPARQIKPTNMFMLQVNNDKYPTVNNTSFINIFH